MVVIKSGANAMDGAGSEKNILENVTVVVVEMTVE